MSTGFIMLCHTEAQRAAQVARHLAAQGAPISIHIDATAPQSYVEALQAKLTDVPLVSYCERFASEWGSWALVAAAEAGATQLLAQHPELTHVFLASGSCLPLRPLAELDAYLAAHPETDFIESVITGEVDWAQGGLERERFTLYFPFSWRRRRWLFDKTVDLQRRLRIRRNLPEGLNPHLGSQWWCLTRATLEAILNDPRRTEFARYFRNVWIPDESYFQTLARRHSKRIESRSLTVSKFDADGRPHVFYDDHLTLLKRSDVFMARKIWPRADQLYKTFLRPDRPDRKKPIAPDPTRIDRIFTQAADRRDKGRSGMYMQSRFPRKGHENGPTAAEYAVFQGFTDIFEHFESWLSRRQVGPVHGHLFAPDRVQFAGRSRVFEGALTDSAELRDYDPRGFLTNLIWNCRGQRQSFQLSPRDRTETELYWFMATDPNAIINVVSGAWAVPLFRSGKPVASIWREAARLQRREVQQIGILNSIWTRGRITVTPLSDFVVNPSERLQTITDLLHPRANEALRDMPQMVDLDGFGHFLQSLRNHGMRPLVIGEFPDDEARWLNDPDDDQIEDKDS